MRQIGLFAISSILVLSLSTSVGTYALLSTSATVEPNNFKSSGFSADSINIINAPPTSGASIKSFRAYNTQQIQFPMFYDSGTYPTGPNPYDSKKSSPSGEIPGGWAPGDQVTRSWNFQNKGVAAKFTKIKAELKSLTDKKGNKFDSTTQVYQDFLKNMKVTVYSPDGRNVFSGTFQQLINGQPLKTSMYLYKGCLDYRPKFVASMDLKAGNDLQGVKGVIDFILTAEQCRNNWFHPPDTDDDDCRLRRDRLTPIKFECYDSNDWFQATSNSNVSLVITGPGLGGGLRFTLNNGLTCMDGQYQLDFNPNSYKLTPGAQYTVSVYNGSTLGSQKVFSAE